MNIQLQVTRKVKIREKAKKRGEVIIKVSKNNK